VRIRAKSQFTERNSAGDIFDQACFVNEQAFLFQQDGNNGGTEHFFPCSRPADGVEGLVEGKALQRAGQNIGCILTQLGRAAVRCNPLCLGMEQQLQLSDIGDRQRQKEQLAVYLIGNGFDG
jgi:hypothetical protein